MLLGSAEWQLEVVCWSLKLVKWNISWHRGGQEDNRVGSVVTCCWWSAGGPLCNPPLCHPPYKHFLAVLSWPPSGEWWYSGGRVGYLITSSGLLADCWSSCGGLVQKRPANTILPVTLGWKLTLCCWSQQSGDLRLAVGSQNQ